MNPLRLPLFLVIAILLFISSAKTQDNQEKHLQNLKQLTFGGENAEAYFSADGKQLIFQSTRDGRSADRQGSATIRNHGRAPSLEDSSRGTLRADHMRR